ncbi:MAG: transglycosylase domain-containing protein, partial [Endomicrobia bacterium]|nr:transglycosylase domain-containing protein [Endomicrobiia bacterium]
QGLFDRNGKLLRLTTSDDQKYRLFIPLSKMPKTLKKGTLLYEDKYFYFHPGFNPAALFKGFWISIIKKERPVGASTITMQLARIIYAIDSRTIFGKLKQILAALWLEAAYGKNDILEAYLNIAPYGYNIEGAGAASLVYFSNRVENLSILEAFSLCVIPQNPNFRRLTDKERKEKMEDARRRVFEKWVLSHPNDTDKRNYFDMPLQIKKPENLPFEAPHFANKMLAESKENEFEIITTLDLSLQKIVEERIKYFIERYKRGGINNASAMLLNYKTMEVEAYVGSADFYDSAIQGQVNGCAAYRSPGSTMKPLIYAIALDKGIIHPMTLLKDTPKHYGVYSPENSDRDFMGPVSAVTALIQSRNIPAIDLLIKENPDNFINILQKAKVKNLKGSDYYGSALAIGGFEISAEKISQLYAMLANRGLLHDLKFKRPFPSPLAGEGRVRGMTNANVQYTPHPLASQVHFPFGESAQSELTPSRLAQGEKAIQLLSPEAAFLALYMLKENRRPQTEFKTAQVYRDFEVYWKTGTSYAFRDAWTAGVFGDYVLVVWIGNFDNEGQQSFMARASAAPLFFEIVQSVSKEKKDTAGSKLSEDGLNLIKADVCSVSGDLPSQYCEKTTPCFFIPGKSPISVCSVHRPVYIDKKTGLRRLYAEPGKTDTVIYEFWSSEIMQIFKLAGISHRVPPRYMPDLELGSAADYGAAPQIILPTPNITYAFRAENFETGTVPFKADADSDAKTIFWFLNDKYIGNSKSGTVMTSKAEPGNYVVRAVDDLGRASVGKLKVEVIGK